jgi:RNA polymerase sigma factor (sigma-70 family)
MEAVVREAGRIALPVAMAVLGDREDAADVAQDVALDVLNGLRRLRNPESFDAWVRRIAVRRSIRTAQRRRLLRGAEFPLDDAEAADGRETPATDTVLLQASLRAALADLSPRQRAAVALRYIHGLSDEEIAAVLGCRAGTASSLLTRARQLLRKNGFLALEGGSQ